MNRKIAPWVVGACLAGGLPLASSAQEAGKPETVVVPGTEVKFDVVSVPAGKCKAGDLKPFRMGKNEVTWGEFELFYGTPKGAAVDGVTRPTPGREFLGQVGLPGHFQEAKRPVICLRWHSAMGYCHFVSKKTGHLYRLPTEAEWEHACLAGAAAAPADQAWSKESSQDRTHEVGEKKPNAFGLCDMLGNVWEYGLEPFSPPDFTPVLRGGAWNMPAAEMVAARRQSIPENWYEQDPNRPRSVWWLTGDYSQGFRMVRVADASDLKDREAYAAKIEVTFQKSEEKTVKKGASAEFFCRVSGEAKNAGDRALDELHVLVHYLDPKGKPHLTDIQGADKPGRATFGYVFPALVNSAYAGDHRQPMKPGESRKFTVDLPQSFDGEEHVQADKFGAQVVGVVFSR